MINYAKDKHVTKLSSHVTSLAALQLMGKIFGMDHLRFYDHETKQPQPICSEDAIRKYSTMKEQFGGNLDVVVGL